MFAVMDDVSQPGRQDEIFQCIVKKDTETKTYRLSLGSCSNPPVTVGKFLLSARKTVGIFGRIDCIISSDDPENITTKESALNVVGKLWSIMPNTKFTIYKSQHNDGKGFSSAEVSAHRTQDFKVGEVDFYGIYIWRPLPEILMQCTLHKMDSEGSELPAHTLFSATSVNMNDSSGSALGLLGYLQSKLRLPNSHARALDSTRSLLFEEYKPLVLKSNGLWRDDRHGALPGVTNTLPSNMDFQLVLAIEPNQPNQEKIILQFRKIGEDTFAMDYSYPLSTFQAFAISMSRFCALD